MPKIAYQTFNFKTDTLKIIDQANEIITEYEAQGFDLTLRQLYYQFVARGLLGNTVQNYKKLGSIVNDARLAGKIDWHRIEDRTRGLESPPAWDGADDIISACANQFRLDLWKDQEWRPEVWIEKEALAGVFERVCRELRVPWLSCRGYTSQSEMWRGGQRLRQHTNNGQKPIILHFGDHDPSGIDMSRDIRDRLKMFMGGVEFKRLALNMDQVEEHSPPPNPAKATDARFEAYMQEYGDESWELDALDPTILSGLVRDAINGLIDKEKWDAMIESEEDAKRKLKGVADDWDNITEHM